MPSTILRVKRRRDEPELPNTIQLESIHSRVNSDHASYSTSSSKRFRNEELVTQELSQLMGNTHLAKNNHSVVTGELSSSKTDATMNKAIVFRKVNPSTKSSSHSSSLFNCRSKRKKEPESSVTMSEVVGSSSIDESITNYEDEDDEQEELHVVEARLELENLAERQESTQHRSKRSKMSIQMLDKRTMMSHEFWKLLRHDSENGTDKKPVSGSIKQDRQIQTKSKGNRILNPNASIVNSSLLRLHEMTIPDFQSHLQLFVDRNLPIEYINWQCTDGSGTISHIIALHNDVEAFKALLLFDFDFLAIKNSGKGILNLSETDGEGRTVFEIATIVGASGIVSILESHGWSSDHLTETSTAYKQEKQASIQDSNDFVYDVYTLHDDDQNDPDNHDVHNGDHVVHSMDKSFTDINSSDKSINLSSPYIKEFKLNNCTLNQYTSQFDPINNSTPIVMNVRGGVGYWGQDGQLILDVFASDHESEHLEDDEYDSNEECCDANDYPEEENSEDDYGNFGGKNIVDDKYFDNYTGRSAEMVTPRFSQDLSMNDYRIDSDSEEMDVNEFRFRSSDLRFNRSRKSADDSQYNSNDDDDDYRGFMRVESPKWSSEKINDYSFEAVESDIDIDST